MLTIEEIQKLSKEEKEQLKTLLAETEKEVKPKEQSQADGELNKVKKEENEIVGGNADDKTVESIAAKHNITVEELEKAIEQGVKVEAEHTTDTEKAREIALDHLAESPKYYEELAKMEEDLKKKELEENSKKTEVVNFNEKLTSLEKRFDEILGKVKEKDEVIKKLEEENAKLLKTTPVGTQTPKPSEDLGDDRKKKDEAMLKQFKEGYKNKQIK